MADLCPKCGKDMGLVGRVHRCVPNQTFIDKKGKLCVVTVKTHPDGSKEIPLTPVTVNVTKNPVTENAKVPVTTIPPDFCYVKEAKRTRGRPPSIASLSNAERQRRYRKRHKDNAP